MLSIRRRRLIILVCLALLLASCGSALPSPSPAVVLESPSPTLATTIEPSLSATARPKPTIQAAVPSTSIPPSPKELAISILYDNRPYDARLTADWGFSALVEYGDERVLFDTGANPQVLMRSMELMEMDPLGIDKIMISHAHGDHTGSIRTLERNGVQAGLFVPPAFEHESNLILGDGMTLIAMRGGDQVAEGVFSTGSMYGMGISEHALIVDTEHGLVIVTGCAHPSVEKIVEQAQYLFDGKPVYLLMGGFHLLDKTPEQVENILAGLRESGVERVAPSHCTGDEAIAAFAAEYGEDFIEIGVGWVDTIIP